jgi:DNA-binding NarL/FixJ family response regulator
MSQCIRLLLVDDHKIVLESLSLLLSTESGFQVVGMVSSGKQALQFLKENEVDILITDLKMPGMTGIELCLKARQEFPSLKILILTMIDDAVQIREAIAAGTTGYVLKNADKAELCFAISTLASGKKFFSEHVVFGLADMLRQDRGPEIPDEISRLTTRELEVLHLIAKEFSTSEIATKLFISVPTAESHRRNLIQKLGVKGTVGLVLYAIKHHIV